MDIKGDTRSLDNGSYRVINSFEGGYMKDL